MLILVCNVGSTSLKYKLFNMPSTDILVEAKTERVGREDAIFFYRNNQNGFSEKLEGIPVPGYADGIRLFLRYLLGEQSGALRSIDKLEEKVGVDFFVNLPADKQAEIEAQDPADVAWWWNN